MSHEKFKLFRTSTKDSFTGQDILNTLDQIQKWSEENKVAPVSIGAVDLTDEDLLVNVGYNEKDSYAVKFYIKEIGTVDEAIEMSDEAMDSEINDFEDGLHNVICHEILIAPGDSKLYMIVMIKL